LDDPIFSKFMMKEFKACFASMQKGKAKDMFAQYLKNPDSDILLLKSLFAGEADQINYKLIPGRVYGFYKPFALSALEKILERFNGSDAEWSSGLNLTEYMKVWFSMGSFVNNAFSFAGARVMKESETKKNEYDFALKTLEEMAVKFTPLKAKAEKILAVGKSLSALRESIADRNLKLLEKVNSEVNENLGILSKQGIKYLIAQKNKALVDVVPYNLEAPVTSSLVQQLDTIDDSQKLPALRAAVQVLFAELSSTEGDRITYSIADVEKKFKEMFETKQFEKYKKTLRSDFNELKAQ